MKKIFSTIFQFELTTILCVGNSTQHSNSLKNARYILLTLLCLGLSSGLSGCAFSGSITAESRDTSPSIPVKLDKAASYEFSSGSDQYQFTLLRNYKVLSSVGSYNRELVQKTPRGYRFYSSVQGILISAGEIQK